MQVEHSVMTETALLCSVMYDLSLDRMFCGRHQGLGKREGCVKALSWLRPCSLRA